MNPISDEILSALLVNDGQSIQTNESKIIEFKSVWDWSNKELLSKIAKTIAGMCNADGGYMFFGVDDGTKEIRGVSDFDKTDASTLTSYLNNYFSPSIKTQKRSILVAGKNIGVIYTEKYQDIPAICIKSSGAIVDGTIYYRYSAMTEAIKGVELIHMMHGLKASNHKESLELQKIDRKRAARPRFEMKTPWFEFNRLYMHFQNKGEVAFIDDIKLKSGSYEFLCDRYNTWVEKNDKFVIHGVPKKSLGFDRYPPGAFTLEYYDEINTKYTLDVNFDTGVFSFDGPFEITD